MTGDGSTTRTPDGRVISWAEYGDPEGLPVVFLHGTPGGRMGRAPHHERYLREGVRVICPERPGYGASGRNPGRSVRDGGADVVTILDALGVERAVVIGGSGGGPHALATADVAPSRVLSVGVLVGAAPLMDADLTELADVNRTVLDAVRSGTDLAPLLAPIRTALLEQGVAAVLDGPESDKELWRAKAEAMQVDLNSSLADGTAGMEDDYRAIWGSPWGFELASISVPVVWMHGRADKAVPLAAAERAAAQLPQCRFITVGSGHAVSEVELAEFEAAVFAAAAARLVRRA
jgi:pimeloyl-ACP methyl ester carboxylesterase